MKWIGLTGGIACGKSEVARLLVRSGVPVVQADQVAHRAFAPESPTYLKVVKAFGPGVLDPTGGIDRGLLGAKVFADSEARSQLEALVHPFVQAEVLKERTALAGQGHAWAAYEVPILFEKNMEANFDRIIVVACSVATQLHRLMIRNQLSEADAKLRIESQWPLDKKRKGADYVVENDGGLEDLSKKVEALKEKIDSH